MGEPLTPCALPELSRNSEGDQGPAQRRGRLSSFYSRFVTPRRVIMLITRLLLHTSRTTTRYSATRVFSSTVRSALTSLFDAREEAHSFGFTSQSTRCYPTPQPTPTPPPTSSPTAPPPPTSIDPGKQTPFPSSSHSSKTDKDAFLSTFLLLTFLSPSLNPPRQLDQRNPYNPLQNPTTTTPKPSPSDRNPSSSNRISLLLLHPHKHSLPNRHRQTKL